MNFIYFCITRENALPHVTTHAFPCVIQKYTKFANFTGLCFLILQYFATKLDNCMKFRMLFPAVLIDFPNSNVCVIGEWSIKLKKCKNKMVCHCLLHEIITSHCTVCRA